jgi:hypothetical protein
MIGAAAILGAALALLAAASPALAAPPGAGRLVCSPRFIGGRWIMIALVLAVVGCTSPDASMADLHAKWRSEEAAQAATDNCGQHQADSACWSREYQRHLNDPVGARAEDSKNRERRSNVLLANWTDCQLTRARELARSDLQAPEAAREALARCDKEREEWVRAQGSRIRSEAEYVASSTERTVYPIILGFIQDLRSGRRQ